MMTRLGLAFCAALVAFLTGCHSAGYHCCGHRRPLAIRPFKPHAHVAPACCDTVGYSGPVEVGYPYASGAVIYSPQATLGPTGPIYSGPVHGGATMQPPVVTPPPMPRP
jgi:hypothetical protein